MDIKENAIDEIHKECDNFLKDYGKALKKLSKKDYDGAIKEIKKK